MSDNFSPIRTRSGKVASVVAGRSGDEHQEAVEAASEVSSRPPQPPSPKKAKMTSQPDLGLLPEFLVNVTRPEKAMPRQFRVLVKTELNVPAKRCRDIMLHQLYPDGNYLEANVITEVNFCNVISYVLSSRVHFVYGTITGRRLDGRVPMARQMRLPASLAQLINCYGRTMIHDGFIEVIPQPWTQETDASVRVQNLVTHAILEQFDNLVVAAHSRGYIGVGFISAIPEGNNSWILKAVDTTNVETIATGDHDIISVRGVFNDFTPADAFFAAIMCNGYDGLVVAAPFIASINNINSIQSTRAFYLTQSN